MKTTFLKTGLGSLLSGVVVLVLSGCNSPVYTTSTGISAPTISVSTSALAFGTIPLGQTSASQSITITNTGNGTALSISSPSVTGANPAAFLTSSNCPSILAKGASCAISAVFSPTASGALSATLTLVDNAPTSPQLIALSGTGSSNGPVVSLSASSLTFANLPVGQAATQTVTLTNIGSEPLSLSGLSVSGANATSFAVSGSCLTQATVATGGSCFVTVTYAPTVTGALSAQVNINDNAPNAPQIIALSSH